MLEMTTQKELVGFFNAIKSEQRANIVTRTPVKLKKTGNPYSQIFKVQTTAVDLNADYAEKVNEERMLQNGDVSSSFVAADRKWGETINGAIVEKDDQFYLKAIEVAKIGTPIYETATGERIEFAQIEPFMPAYSAPKKQELADVIKYRTYKLDNIIGMNIEGKARFVQAK